MSTSTTTPSSSAAAAAADFRRGLVVVSCVTPDAIVMDEATGTEPMISDTERAVDALDAFNHPRYRRGLILKTLEAHAVDAKFQTPSESLLFAGKDNNHDNNNDDDDDVKMKMNLKQLFAPVHSARLLEFLTSAWSRWDALGEDGQDPVFSMEVGASSSEGTTTNTTTGTTTTSSSSSKPLIPICVPLPRDPHQRPSKNVMGEICFFCTDPYTPIIDILLQELEMDAAIIQTAVDRVMVEGSLVYALPTHPGHHAARDSFGGYCYLNQVALAATLLQTKHGLEKVAILDIDYHCGNGTASIFYEDPTVLVVSLHCDPEFDYPFHHGYSDQTGSGAGVGTTLHLPMPPKTDWSVYAQSLDEGLKAIQDFGAQAVVVSMGLDTLDQDPCANRRAGFCLEGHDYVEMGQRMGRALSGLPTMIVQEGGYRMEKVGQAATDVILGFYDTKAE